ncbi:MAG TPA: monovalent cation:proton antiporter-2 (CPA2) family protein [Hyphomicrobiales bacterium]|nr:monovalent cation:proton antiporter-2 (CPA2) family protein [Hyphomicrobiales bacterium]
MNGHASGLPLAFLIFLVAAALTPPLFKRAGLPAVVGYLAVGILIGPAALGIFVQPEETLDVAELGVVLLLFVIGLELDVSRLVAMRRDIVLLGLAQLVVTAAVLGGLAFWLGLTPRGAAVAGFALALSSTAVATRLLDDRGHITRAYGQRAFAVLLAQDFAVVPALALVPLLGGAGAPSPDLLAGALRTLAGLAAFAAILATGRYLTDPILRVLARSGTGEVMIAAALLLVFGAAWVADLAGLSMALGAFLAGLLLSQSRYRHELAADVEPFRGLLLALFFMGVGMSLDLGAVAASWPVVAGGLAALIAVKLAVTFVLSRVGGGSGREDALRIAALLVPASEFAFVLMPVAAGAGVIASKNANLVSAIGVLSMLVGPVLAAAIEKIRPRLFPHRRPTGIDDGLAAARGEVLVIGFGRFGHIAAQLLLAEGIETTLIDGDPDRIRNAARFGFKVYYGDGTRPDVLRAAGAARMRAFLVCVENPDAALLIVEHLHAHYPGGKILARSFDRVHSLALLDAGADYELRETYESALLFGRTALETLGLDAERAQAIEADVRRRDLERFELQRAEGIYAGLDLMHQKTIRPEPLVEPARRAEALNTEAAEAAREETKKEEAAENA